MVSTSKRSVAVATAAFMVAGSGIAFAYWTQGGSGNGKARTGDTVDISVNQSGAVTGLYPGGPAQPLAGTFDNPNDGPVRVGAVTATVAGTDAAGCDASNYRIAGTSTVSGPVEPGRAQGSWSGLTIEMLNLDSNQDACKGARISIEYSVTPGA